MTQKTERELFEAAAESLRMDTTLLVNSKTPATEYEEIFTEQLWQDWKTARAPLLSRIAELEAENNKLSDALEAEKELAEHAEDLMNMAEGAVMSDGLIKVSEVISKSGAVRDSIYILRAALISQKVEG